MGAYPDSYRDEPGIITLPISIKSKKPQISLRLFWWYQLESNQRHKDFQSFALPTELWYQTIPVLFGTANVVSFFV